MSDYRTSLSHLPSGQTEADIARRRAAWEAELYRRHRIVIIGRDDPDLSEMERILCDQVAEKRFGRRA